jgi:hypothetical protein
MAEESWATWNDGEGIRAHEFTRHVVDHFHLHHSQSLRIGEKNRKGYKRDWFRDAHDRYVDDEGDEDEGAEDAAPPPHPATPPQARHTVTTHAAQRNQAVTTEGLVTASDSLRPLSDNGRDVVTDSRGGYGETEEEQGAERDEPDTLDGIADWERVRVAAIRDDDPDHGLRVAQARAEAARRRIAVNRTATQ